MLATFNIFLKSSVAAKIRLNDAFWPQQSGLHSKYLLSRFSEPNKISFNPE